MDDDSGCTAETRALDCGLDLTVFCAVAQTARSCPSSCSDDDERVDGAPGADAVCTPDGDPGDLSARATERDRRNLPVALAGA